MYKTEKSFQERYAESSTMLQRFADRIPIIVEKKSTSKKAPLIDKRKFLAPSSLTLAQLIFVIRRRLKLTPEEAIFVFVNGKLVQPNTTLSACYAENKDEDGFLYVTYDFENTFG